MDQPCAAAEQPGVDDGGHENGFDRALGYLVVRGFGGDDQQVAGGTEEFFLSDGDGALSAGLIDQLRGGMRVDRNIGGVVEIMGKGKNRQGHLLVFPQYIHSALLRLELFAVSINR